MELSKKQEFCFYLQMNSEKLKIGSQIEVKAEAFQWFMENFRVIEQPEVLHFCN